MKTDLVVLLMVYLIDLEKKEIKIIILEMKMEIILEIKIIILEMKMEIILEMKMEIILEMEIIQVYHFQ